MPRKQKNEETVIKPPKNITISTKVTYQTAGVLFEIAESHSFSEKDYSVKEIENMKIELLSNNLISINNFQKQIED